MGYGDGFAAVVGNPLACETIQIFGSTKSLSGSATMLVIFFLVSAILLGATGQPQVLLPALVLAVLATIIEAATPLGLDNLTVPLLTSGAYYFLFVL